jgi:hypothetical protein
MFGAARVALDIPCKFIVVAMHAVTSYVVCHGLAFMADRMHQQHCSNGFFLSMIPVSSGPCRMLRHVSTALQDNALNLIIGVGTSLMVTRSVHFFGTKAS